LQAGHRQCLAVISLKGAPQAETVYPHRAVRPKGGIGLLVRPEALQATDDALTALSYRFRTMGDRTRISVALSPDLSAPPAAPFAVPIEVYWALERTRRPFRIDREGLW
jgi:hypothetical protein